MKTFLAAALLLAISGALAFADDKDSPPVAMSQPEPEWPPELSKSYSVTPAKVIMIVDERGVPFSLNGNGLPDNVVTALAEWRYRPARKNGAAVPCTISLMVPIRAALDESSASSLRRRSYYISKTLDDALHSGTGLDAGGAEQLEKSLATDPSNIERRGRLLIYSIEADPSSARAAADRRARQIEFLVRSLPKEAILASPLAAINKDAGPLADPDAYGRIRDLWLMQAAAMPLDSAVLEHASYFLRISDPEKTEQLLLPAIPKVPEAAVWLGDLYGLSLLGVNGLDLRTGRAVSVSPAESSGSFASTTRAALMTNNDPKVVISALNTIVDQGRSLSKLGALPDDYSAICSQLLVRAQSLNPALAITCDPSATAPPAPRQEVSRIRVGGNVQQANLIQKVAPIYPAEAKAQGIEGVIRFTVIIDKDGTIKNLTYVSGPLALYRSARDAVKQWKYKRTLLNSKPVEVVTTIEVNYSLTR